MEWSAVSFCPTLPHPDQWTWKKAKYLARVKNLWKYLVSNLSVKTKPNLVLSFWVLQSKEEREEFPRQRSNVKLHPPHPLLPLPLLLPLLLPPLLWTKLMLILLQKEYLHVFFAWKNLLLNVSTIVFLTQRTMTVYVALSGLHPSALVHVVSEISINISLINLYPGFPLAAEKYGVIQNNTCVAEPNQEGVCEVTKDYCQPEGFVAVPHKSPFPPFPCYCKCDPIDAQISF